jgi:hypothetical protein
MIHSVSSSWTYIDSLIPISGSWLSWFGRLIADIELDGLVVDVLSDGRVLFAQTGLYGLIDLSVRRLRLVGSPR